MFTEVEIPEGVEARKENSYLIIKGEKGELKRQFKKPGINFEIKDKKVVFESKDNRKGKRLINTFAAHARNMIRGVTKGYEYKLKVIHTHFPITVKKQDDWVLIENIFGEKNPRKARIMPDTEVIIQGDEIIVRGIDIEKTGQTAANIENAAKRSGFDRRVFQDGIYITEKAKEWTK